MPRYTATIEENTLIYSQMGLMAHPVEFRWFVLGGNWDNGSNDGVSALNANNSLGNSNANNGARLACFLSHKNHTRTGPCLSAKNDATAPAGE